MIKLSRVIIWLALTAIGLLMVFSVVGAFYGAERARQFFNSTPLMIYWYVFATLLVAGFIVFPQLLRKHSSLLIHAGCLFVLIGAMSGSQTGHQLAKRFLGIDKIPSGYMVIYEGHSDNRVVTEDFNHILGQLPFRIKLNDFRVEYYDSDKKSSPQAAGMMNVMVRDYLSDITVIENEKEITRKTIEVNHPLHYGGYHFCQHSYDSVAGQYTILSATSDSGLYLVYGGYWLLSLGVLWQFWFGPSARYIKGKQKN